MTTAQLNLAIKSFEDELRRMRRRAQLVEAAKAGKADVKRIHVRETKVRGYVRPAYTYLTFARRA